MRRALKTLGWLIGLVIAIPLLLVVAVFVGLNTDPGRQLAERLTVSLTDGMVRIEGLSGAFPSQLRIARIAVADAKGPWITVDDAALDWNPLRLANRLVQVQRLAAREVDVARLPESSGPSKPGSSGTFELPVKIDLARLDVARIAVAASVMGTAVAARADGKAHLDSLQQGAATLALQRLDGAGTYDVRGTITPETLNATLHVQEPAGGLIEQVAKARQLGPIRAVARVAGPWAAAATDLTVSAGQLRAAAKGTVDIPGKAANLDVTADAPAMSPTPGVSWQRVALALHLAGKLTQPQGHGTLEVDKLAASGAGVGALRATFNGDLRAITLAARAEAVHIPGPKPDLLAAAPVTLDVTEHLDQPGHLASVVISHPLFDLRGMAETDGATSRARAHLSLPDLATLTAAAGQDVQGHAALDLAATQSGRDIATTVAGTVAVTGGTAPLPALLGPDAHIGAAGALKGQALQLSRLQIDGRTLHLGAHGSMDTAGALDLDWQLALGDLAAIAPGVQGNLSGQGHVAGPTSALAVQAALRGDVGGQGFPPGPVTLNLDAHGLPDAPAGTVTAQGTLDGAPLALDVSAARGADGTLHARIARADWKSAHAEGAFSLAQGARLPLGTLALKMTRLADLAPLIGQKITGSVVASATVAQDRGQPKATLKADVRDAGLSGAASVGRATLDAAVLDPMQAADVTASLDVAGLRAGAIAGTAKVTARGKQQALALRADTALSGVSGGDLTASFSATADVPAKRVILSALQVAAHGETLRLLAPARLDLANGIAVDRARLALGDAGLDVAGRISPTLDVTASLRNVTPALLRPFDPSLDAAGRLDAEARLQGTTARPTGTAHVTATDLRLLTGTAAALPAARVTADAKLNGATAQIDMRADAGRNDLRLAGIAPIAPNATMNLRAQGSVDLATFNPLISAQGESVLGHVALDATATGTLAAPRAAGSLRLTGGDVQDYVLGAHLSDISALVRGSGDTVQLAQLTAHAGRGTISGSGTVGLGGTMPVDLRIAAHNATPFSSDKLTVTLDGDLSLRGAIQQALAADGAIIIDRADFRIPDKLPTSVPVLQVRRPGAPPPGASATAPSGGSTVPVALNVTVRAPGQVFIRGRGIFAELYGQLRVTGTSAAPQPVGAFNLRRGTLDFAGQTLAFSSGKISFNGGSISDPSLNLVATSSTNSIVAMLTIGGTASAPTVTLSSVPPLPQDEVLAQLLFHQSAGSLSPFQLASAVASLAQLSGAVGTGGFDPVESVRKGLGLDRLSVGGGQNGTGTTVEAGRYVAPGVYAGVRQATSGQGSQATVQIDLLKGLKLEGAVGTGAPTTVTGAGSSGDPYGTSVGLTYRFQY